MSAVRTENSASAFHEQFDDYTVIAAQNPGHLAGNVQFNQEFLQAYAASGTMSTGAYDSWEAYNNWVLGVEDVRSSRLFNGETLYRVWDGTPIDYRGYKGWHIHEKSTTYNAVIPP